MKLANLKTQAPTVNFSNHNLTHSITTSMEMGKLVPILCQEVLPNDRIDLEHEFFVRFSPLVAPILSEVNLKIYSFYVPMRSVWTRWKKFMSETTIADSPEIPSATIADLYSSAPQLFTPTSLSDYLGIPMAQFYSGAKTAGLWINDGLPMSQVDEPISLLPFVAYQKIYNRWFRDENLEEDWCDEDATTSSGGAQMSVNENIWHQVINGNGIIDLNEISPEAFYDLFMLRTKAWEKDYFTSALPSPQFGDPISVPVDAFITWEDVQSTTTLYDAATNTPINLGQDATITDAKVNSEGKLYLTVENSQGLSSEYQVAVNNADHLGAEGGSFTINEFRMASAIQRYQESLMRAGHRYEEQMRYQFDQIVPNSYLEEPELIHASSIPVQINDVTQTSGDMEIGGESISSPQGTQTGQAMAYNNGKNARFRYHCPDHGYVISIVCVLPRSSYMNGLPRKFTRFSRLDYFNPIFENVGDEAILNKEIFLGTNHLTNNKEFGYMPRYADYKVGHNIINGEMTNNLLLFNLGRKFASLPGLNNNFIKVDSGTTNRSFAVTNDVQHLWCIGKNHVFMRRPMQYNPIPKLI